jgi:hypothetical protein
MEEHEALNMIDEQNRWQDVRYDSDGIPNGSFPYPPKFIRSEAQGELAKRIRTVFAGDDEDVQERLEYEPVYLTEKTVFGGYSEYTQENLTYLKVTCAEFEQEFDPSNGGYYQSLIESLLEWLDQEESTEKDKSSDEGESAGSW